MKFSLILIIALLLSSCATNNDVVRSGFLQKKKYSKGYHLSFKKEVKVKHSSKADCLAAEDTKEVKVETKKNAKVSEQDDKHTEKIIATVKNSPIANDHLEASLTDQLFEAETFSKLKSNVILTLEDPEIIEEPEPKRYKANFFLLMVVSVLGISLFFIGLIVLGYSLYIGNKKIRESKDVQTFCLHFILYSLLISLLILILAYSVSSEMLVYLILGIIAGFVLLLVSLIKIMEALNDLIEK